MGRKLILGLVFLLSNSYILFAQEADFREVNKNTYDLYLNGSWSELISTGEKALKQGLDYYYLRMRLGIAAYEIKDYAKAVRHFMKALEFNSSDITASEYLYYALLLYGRDMEAHNLAQSFPRSLKDKLSYKSGQRVRSVDLSINGSFLHDQEKIESQFLSSSTETDGFQSVTRDFIYLSGGLVHDVGSSMRFTHNLGLLAKSYMVTTRESLTSNTDTEANLKQFQYYLSGKILLSHGSFLIPSIHYISVSIPYETVVTGRRAGSYTVRQNYFLHDFAASLGIEKYYGKVMYGLFAGYSDINDQQHLQGNIGFSFFPIGNLNLYGYSDITLYSVLPENKKNELIFSQTIGFRPIPGLWVELLGSWGEKENFAGPRALLIYNDIGLISEQYGLNLIMPLKKMEFSLNYKYNVHESRYTPSDSDAYININSLGFKTHIISGGVKWNF